MIDATLMLSNVDNVVGDMLPRPRTALEYQTNKGVEVLINWEGLSLVGIAIWEILDDIQERFSYFVIEDTDKDNPMEDGALRMKMETTYKLSDGGVTNKEY